MFGIAGSEWFVILIVALVVVGPKDLPRVMRTIGQWTGRARSMADQFRRSFDEMARQSELEELRAQVNQLRAETEEAARSAANIDHQTLGLPENALRFDGTIEEVGAAPPKPAESPAAVAAEVQSAMIAQEAPAAPEDAPVTATPAVQSA
jgi:sec-independent protein translocase protein TatB